MIVLKALWWHRTPKVTRLGLEPQARAQKSQRTNSIKFVVVSVLHENNFEHVFRCKMGLIRLHSMVIFLFTGGTENGCKFSG